MVTHASIAAWKIPWTEEPGGLPSMGSQRVRHDSATQQKQVINKACEINFNYLIHYIQNYHSFIIKCTTPHP